MPVAGIVQGFKKALASVREWARKQDRANNKPVYAVNRHTIRFRPVAGPLFGPAIVPEQPKEGASRQERRAYLRSVSFAKISEMVPLASRRQRRNVARLMGSQYWRDLRRAETAPKIEQAAA